MAGVDVTVTEWPDSCKELKDLDELLRCPICYEYINTAMLVPKCSHNYCSLCIRRYICYKTQCPTCTAAVVEPDLINNRVLDDFIQKFNAVRPKLLDALQKSVEQCLQPEAMSIEDIPLNIIPKDLPPDAKTLNPSEQCKSGVKSTPVSKKGRPHKVKKSLHKDEDEDWIVEKEIVPMGKHLVHPKRRARRASKAASKTIKSLCTDISHGSESGSDFDETPVKKKKQLSPGIGDADEDYDVDRDVTLYSSDDDFKVTHSGKKSQPKEITQRKEQRQTYRNKNHASNRPSCRNVNNTSLSSTDSEDVVCLSDMGSPRTPLVPRAKLDMMSPPQIGPSRHRSSSEEWKKVMQSPLSKIPSSPASIHVGSASPRIVSPGPSLTVPQPGTSAQQSQPGGNVPKVPCPVCAVEVPERNINLHLDRCLSGTLNNHTTRSFTKRKPMTKVVYNLLKDKELKKKCAAVGLSTQGDRQALIARHKEFCLRYNAQCDSLNPKSEREIVRNMERDEKTKEKVSLAVPAGAAPKLAVTKGASSEEVQEAQQNYVKAHKSQFAQLIADAKKRRGLKSTKESVSQENQSAVVPSSGTEYEKESKGPNDVPQESTCANLLAPNLPTLPQISQSSDASGNLFVVQPPSGKTDTYVCDAVVKENFSEKVTSTESKACGEYSQPLDNKLKESQENDILDSKRSKLVLLQDGEEENELPCRQPTKHCEDDVEEDKHELQDRLVIPQETSSLEGCTHSGCDIIWDEGDCDSWPDVDQIQESVASGAQPDCHEHPTSTVCDLEDKDLNRNYKTESCDSTPPFTTQKETSLEYVDGRNESCESSLSPTVQKEIPSCSAVEMCMSSVPTCTNEEIALANNITGSPSLEKHGGEKLLNSVDMVAEPKSGPGSHILMAADFEANCTDGTQIKSKGVLVPNTPDKTEATRESHGLIAEVLVGAELFNSSPSHVSESLPGSFGSADGDILCDGDMIPQSPEQVHSSKSIRGRGKRKHSEDVTQTKAESKRTRKLEEGSAEIELVSDVSLPRRRSLRPRKKAV